MTKPALTPRDFAFSVEFDGSQWLWEISMRRKTWATNQDGEYGVEVEAFFHGPSGKADSRQAAWDEACRVADLMLAQNTRRDPRTAGQ